MHFVGGAFLELLTWWLESKSPVDPTEIERVFLQMALPALKLVQS